MKIDGTLTVVAAFSAADEATARADAARLLMAVAIGILEGDNHDPLTGGAWVLALMPEVPE